MNNIYSSAYLYRFLRLVAKQQRVPTSVLQAWRAAANALLPAGNAQQDLREFDLDAAIQHYVDQQLLRYKTILPWQIHQHRSAFESMLSDFLLFSSHPKHYLAALTALHADQAVGAVGAVGMAGTDVSAGRRSAMDARRNQSAYMASFQDILQSLPRPRRVKVISPLTAANDE